MPNTKYNYHIFKTEKKPFITSYEFLKTKFSYNNVLNGWSNKSLTTHFHLPADQKWSDVALVTANYVALKTKRKCGISHISFSPVVLSLPVIDDLQLLQLLRLCNGSLQLEVTIATLPSCFLDVQ